MRLGLWSQSRQRGPNVIGTWLGLLPWLGFEDTISLFQFSFELRSIWITTYLFLSWTWSVSWWKDDQLKELWWGPLKKATKKSARPPDYDLSSFFSGRWLVCWINFDIPTCKTPNPLEKKLDIPPPPTHKVLVFSKMSWWKDGHLSLCIWSWPLIFLVLDLVCVLMKGWPT